jgi:DNA-binding response OmpR family regulator
VIDRSKNIAALSAKNRYTVTLDDDPIVHKVIEKITEMPSYNYFDTQTFFQKIRQLRPLAFFIDVHIGMELETGIEVVPKIKSIFQTIPVIVITSDLNAEILGRALDVGADDFIKKPICGSELLARFKARLFNLREQAQHNILRYSDVALDPITGRLSGNGKRCLISPLESKILSALIKGQGHPVSKEILKQQAWGQDTTTDNALTRKVFELRKAISETSHNLELRSVYGKGFSLVSSKS